jgi:hypothetical protein
VDVQAFDAYLLTHRERLLEDYKDFLRQPSVAATGQGIPEMAALVARRLAALGAEVKVVPTEGSAPPVVWAELGQGERELLIYNHYDVQPQSRWSFGSRPHLNRPSAMASYLPAARPMTKASWPRGFTPSKLGWPRKARCLLSSNG